MNTKIFREYDIRGVYPSEINEDVAYTVGRSYASILRERYNKKICVVGMDNRLSSPSLHDNLIKGLNESGLDVIDLGLCTTPMFFYGCIYTHNLGIMVTASHNPKDDNGFKFSFDELGNARGKQVYDFRDYTLEGNFLKGNGKVMKLDILPYYLSLMKDSINMGQRKLKVVIDPGCGTTALFAEKIHRQFPNLELVMINNVSDATFPAHHPDPAVYENLKQLQDKVMEVKANLGIAYDGDGDRVGIVDNLGNIIPIDKYMVIIMRDLFNKIDDKRILYDVKCSKVIEEEAKKLGGEAIICRTGASYTRYEINKNDIPFGGEYSGHIVFRNNFKGFDSGIYAGLRLIELLSNTNKELSELLDGLTNYYNTPEIKIKVSDDNKFTIVDKVKEYVHNNNYEAIEIDGIRVNYNDAWALIRASNTGPNLTLRFEATSIKRLEELKQEYIELINKIINTQV